MKVSFSVFSPGRRWLAGALSIAAFTLPGAAFKALGDPRFVDLSLLVAPEYPVTWPSNWPFFQINPYLRIGPLSAYNSEILTIDGNTGTQLDFPPHSVPAPGTNLPNAGPLGLVFGEKVPAWQFVGEACVIDVSPLIDKAPNGKSSLIYKDDILNWEKKHRPLGFGDIVLFRSGYSDKYFRPFPHGRRFAAEPLEGKTPAWPDPHPETMDYLGRRGVMALGTDSPSMGPIPDLAEPTHLAGLKYGMIWTEGVTRLDSLPPTGAFYCVLTPKHSGGATSESRAFAVAGDPLAKQLIESARKKRVIDLSMTLADDAPLAWSGTGVGHHRQPYVTANFLLNPVTGLYQQTHIMDSHTGTHLVPPSYALPGPEFNNRDYSPEAQEWLADYEKQYGARGTSQITAEQVPISQTCGWVRVISVGHLMGKISRSHWPDSAEITVADIQKFESRLGPLNPGEIVIFRSDYSERCAQKNASKECMESPLNGQSEGWPALGPAAILYLDGKGIRCVATDGPSLGGANPRRALMTYWALGSRGMVGLEYLTNLRELPERAYLLFAAPKIRGCHGGVGRAIALF